MGSSRQVQIVEPKQTGPNRRDPNRQVQIDGSRDKGLNRLIQINGSKQMGPKRQAQIDRTKQTGLTRQVQIDGSKQTGLNTQVQIYGSKLVQNGQTLSKKFQNQPKNYSKGSGTNRSPGLYIHLILLVQYFWPNTTIS